MKTLGHCELCNAPISVTHDPHEGLWSVFQAIIAEHAKTGCDGGRATIRIDECMYEEHEAELLARY